MKPGNKQNAALNGEYARHVRKDGKKITSGLRRAKVAKDTKKILNEDLENQYNELDTDGEL